MADCESTHRITRPSASWRCRGNGHADTINISRDRRLWSNFDMAVGPSPPSYTFTMQHQCNYILNQPSVREMTTPGSIHLKESNHSLVDSVSLIQVVSEADGNEETRLDEVGRMNKAEEAPLPPPPYDAITTCNN